jgi:hypothetical protein
MASDDAGSAPGVTEDPTFSAEQLVVIDHLIAARVVAASASAPACGHLPSSSPSSSVPSSSDSGKLVS